MRSISIALLVGSLVATASLALGQTAIETASSPNVKNTAVGMYLPATQLSDEQLRAKCFQVFSGNYPNNATRYTGVLTSTSKSVFSWAGKKLTFDFKTKGEIVTDNHSGKRYCSVTLSWWDEAHRGFWNSVVAFNGEMGISWSSEYFPIYPQYYVKYLLLPNGSLELKNHFYQPSNIDKLGLSQGLLTRQ